MQEQRLELSKTVLPDGLHSLMGYSILASANINSSAEMLGTVLLHAVRLRLCCQLHAHTDQTTARPRPFPTPKGRNFKFISFKINSKTQDAKQYRCLKSNKNI